MTKYVLGFAFDRDHNTVLIRKARPAWQKGRLNGIGGHIEAGETPHDAMVREFREETGHEIPVWDEVAFLEGEKWQMWVFRGYGDVSKCRTTTDEPIQVVSAFRLPAGCIENLYWLVPLCIQPPATYRVRVN